MSSLACKVKLSSEEHIRRNRRARLRLVVVGDTTIVEGISVCLSV